MKKNYRLTIDFEIDINEKIKVPGNMEDNGECTPEILEKTQHIMDAFFKGPRIMFEFIKNRFFERILCNEYSKDEIAEVLGLHTDEELISLLVPHLPPGAVSYLLGIFLGDKNFSCKDDDDAALNAMLLYQFGDFTPVRGSIIEQEKDCNSIMPVSEPCLGNCILARKLKDFFLQNSNGNGAC